MYYVVKKPQAVSSAIFQNKLMLLYVKFVLKTVKSALKLLAFEWELTTITHSCNISDIGPHPIVSQIVPIKTVCFSILCPYDPIFTITSLCGLFPQICRHEESKPFTSLQSVLQAPFS